MRISGGNLKQNAGQKRLLFFLFFPILFFFLFRNVLPSRAEDVVSVGVEKIWVDDNSADRPQFVGVTLKKGNTTHSVTLTADNDWKGVIDNVEISGNYTVTETGIPDGYSTSVVQGELVSPYTYPTNISNAVVDLSTTVTDPIEVTPGSGWYISDGLRTDYIETPTVAFTFDANKFKNAVVVEYDADGNVVTTGKEFTLSGTNLNWNKPAGKYGTDHYLTMTFKDAATISDGTLNGTTKDVVLTLKNFRTQYTNNINISFLRFPDGKMWGYGTSNTNLINYDVNFTVPGVTNGKTVVTFVDIDITSGHEAVYLKDGFEKTIYTVPLNDKSASALQIVNGSVKTALLGTDEYLKIYATGDPDNNSYASGLLAMAELDEDGFTFEWQGDNGCGTAFFVNVTPFQLQGTVDGKIANFTGGTISSLHNWTYRNYGETVVVTVTPDEGYHVKSLIIDGTTYNNPSSKFNASGVWTLSTGVGSNKENITLYQRENGVIDIVLPKQYFVSGNSAPARVDHSIDASFESNGLAYTYTVTNTLTTSISGEKYWVNGTATVPAYSNLGLEVYRKSESEPDWTPVPIESSQVTWSGIAYTIKNLAKYDANDMEYTYRVVEKSVAGFEAFYGDEELSSPLTDEITNPTKITNKLVQTYLTVQGSKTWVDGGRNHNNASDLSVTLYRAKTTNGTCATAGQKEAISTTPNWTDNIYRFENLPRYDENRFAYCYTVAETPTYTESNPDEKGDYYVSAVDGSGLNFTNTLVGPKTSFTGTKRWMEGDSGTAHENASEIVLELYQQSETVSKRKITGKTVTWDGNTFTYSDLDKYDAKGYPYVYTAHETTISGNTPANAGYQVYYDSSSDPWNGTTANTSGTIITNVRYETISVSGTKTWAGDNGKSHTNNSEVVLTLTRTGTKSGSEEETVIKTPSWSGNTYTYSSLPKYDTEGYEYIYKVSETPVDGYTTTYDAETHLNITNTKNYNVKHEFVIDVDTQSQHPDLTLPTTITSRLPENQTGKPSGSTVTPSDFNTDPVTISSGTWVFDGWDAESKTVGTEDVTFTGIWRLAPRERTEQAKYIASGPGADSSDVNVGDELTYTITWYNWQNEASPVTVTDEVPEGTTFVSCSGGTSCSHNDGTVTWTVDNAAVDANGDLTMNVKVTGTSAQTITNSALVTIAGDSRSLSYKVFNAVKDYNVKHQFAVSEETQSAGITSLPSVVADLLPADQTGKKNTETVYPTAISETDKTVLVTDGKWTFDSWDENSKTVNKADVVFTGTWSYTGNTVVPPTKTVSPASVDVGEQITYTIGYTNWQNTPATVVITDDIPAGTKFVSASDDGKLSSNGKTVTWTLSLVPAGTTGSVTLVLETLSTIAESVTNTANVKIGGHDPVPVTTDEDNTVKVKKYAIRYEFVSGTTGMELPEALTQRAEAATAASTAVYNGITVTPSTSIDTKAYNVTEGIWSFSPGWDKRSYTVNQADVKFTGTWTYKANSVTTPTKSIAASSAAGRNGAAVNTGDQITYGIYYKNWTNDTVTVTITDPIPDGMSFVSATNGGTSDGTKVTWTLSGKSALFAETVNVTYKVDLAKVLEYNAGHAPEKLTSVTNRGASVVIDPDTTVEGDEYTYDPGEVTNRINTYSVSQTFVSGTPGKALPESIRTILSTIETLSGFYTGETVQMQDVTFQQYLNTTDGTWVFDKWDTDHKVIGTANTSFTGTWVFLSTVTGTKTWLDGSITTHDNTALTLTLTRTDYDGGNETVISAVPAWSGNTYTFSDLPMKDEQGNDYIFTVTETAPDGYSVSYDENNRNNMTNLRVGTVAVSGMVTWKDGEKYTHTDSDDVSLVLKRKSAESGSVTETVTAEDGTSPLAPTWDNTAGTYAFSDLPQFDSKGYKYTYTVEAAPTDSMKNRMEAGDSYAVTSTVDPENEYITDFVFRLTGTTTKTGEVTWQDGGITSHDNGSAITLMLYRESTNPDGSKQTAPSTYMVTWTGDGYTYSGLDLYDEDGYPYTYTVHVMPKPGYAIFYDDGTTPWDPDAAGAGGVTGTDFILRRVGTKNYVFTKTWLDGIHTHAADDITITLYRQSAAPSAVKEAVTDESGLMPVPVKAGSDNSFTYTWQDMTQFDELGYEYTYSVHEDAIDSQYAAYSYQTYYDNSTTPWESDAEGTVTTAAEKITNLLVGTTESVSFTKIWKVGVYADDHKADDITLSLYRKSEKSPQEKVENPNMTSTAVDANTFIYTFTGLDTYDRQGWPYTYSIHEDSISNHDDYEYNVYYDESDIPWQAADDSSGTVTTATTKITNQLTGIKPHIFTKIWADGNDAVSHTAGDITLKLYRQSETVQKELVRDDAGDPVQPSSSEAGIEPNSIIYSYENLSVFDAEGHHYTYTVHEAEVTGYDSYYDDAAVPWDASASGADTMTAVEKIRNARKGSADFTFSKIWKDAVNSHTAADITPVLYWESEKVEKAVVPEEKAGTMTTVYDEDTKSFVYTYSGLDQYDPYGYSYTYSVHEEKINNHDAYAYNVYYDESTTIWDAEAEHAESVTAQTKITNQLTGKTEKSGQITWEDGYESHSSGAEVTLVFYRKSAQPDAELENITDLVSWDGDTYNYGDLPEYDEEGYPYTYSVHMNPIEGYAIYYDGSTTPWDPDAEGAEKVTGTDIKLRRTGTYTFNGMKYWVGDAASTTHMNETEVCLKLFRTSAKEGSAAVAVPVTAPLTFDWYADAFTYGNLPQFDDEGYLYTYTVEEAEIPGYTTTYAEGTHIIYNTKNWKVRYAFGVDESTAEGFPGRELPDVVLAVLPAAEDFAYGTDVIPPQPEQTEILDYDGTWTWAGWDAVGGIVGAEDMTFTGSWKFTPNDAIGPTIRVVDDSSAGVNGDAVYTGDEITYEIGYTNYLNDHDNILITFELPEGTEYVPGSGGSGESLNGRTVTWTLPAEGHESGSVRVTVSVSPELVKSGKTSGIQAKAAAAVGPKEALPTEEIENPVHFRGFYEYVSADPDLVLPEGLPALPETIIGKAPGDSVAAGDAIKVGTEVLVSDGVWTFKGWAPTSAAIDHEDILFTGTWKYTTIPHGDPPVRKLIREGDGSETDQFTFRMTSVGNTAGLEVNPMPEGSVNGEKQVTISGSEEFEFGDFSFRKPGTYIYELAEVDGGLDSYAYDRTVYTLIWYVEEDEEGNLTAEKEVEIDGVLTEVSVPYTFEFENVKLPESSVYPKVKKVISEGTPEVDETFTFRLTGISNTVGLNVNPMPKNTEGSTAEIQIKGSGREYFGLIEFPKDGDYLYEIEEIPGDSAFYAYDSSVYSITWHVINGKVSAEIMKNGTAAADDQIIFENVWLKGGTSAVHPKVIKQVQGSTNRKETFSFLLTPLYNNAGVAVNPMPKGSSDEGKTIWIIGEGERSFGSISFEKAGVYAYKITEIPGNTANWTYDKTAYTLTYVVTEKADGDGFDISLSVMKDQKAEESDQFIFVNTYSSGGNSEGSGGGGGLGILELPRTGFAPGIQTKLPESRVNYSRYSQLRLEIPGLGVDAEILGVPLVNGVWDVSWLGDNVGWLESTAWPGSTYAGNVVLSAHSINYLGYPGVFSGLQKLGYGSTIYLNAYGEKLTYIVQSVQTVYADTPQVLSQNIDYPELTLITCKYYNENTGEYDGRVVVKARLSNISAMADMTPKVKSGAAAEMNFADGLPKMGFPPAAKKVISERPKNILYRPTRFTLEIPKLDLSAGLIEIPYYEGDYPVEWMGDAVGILEKSEMPGQGQSVIVAHNHLNSDDPGPFFNLIQLEEGDRVFLTDKTGRMMIFSVYANEKVDAFDVRRFQAIASQDPFSITFITCEDELLEGGYANRRIVAVRPVR